MDTIKELFNRLLSQNKTKVINILSKEYGLSESSVRTNWFSSGKVPDHCKFRVHEILMNALRAQIESAKNLTD